MRYVAGISRLALTTLGTCLLAAAIAVGIAGAAGGEDTATSDGSPVLTVEGSFAPTALPSGRQTPISLDLRGRVESPPGHDEHPAAIRTLQIKSPDLELHTKGIPVCQLGIQVQAADGTGTVEERCRPALIGTGTAVAEVAFAEEGPIDVKAHSLVFNGGTRQGKTTLFVHTYFSTPILGAIDSKVTVTHLPGSRSGALAIARIPQITGGSGSIVEFHLTIRRDVGGHNPISATCADGKVSASVLGEFEDGTQASTEIIRPCGRS